MGMPIGNADGGSFRKGNAMPRGSGRDAHRDADADVYKTGEEWGCPWGCFWVEGGRSIGMRIGRGRDAYRHALWEASTDPVRMGE